MASRKIKYGKIMKINNFLIQWGKIASERGKRDGRGGRKWLLGVGGGKDGK